MIKRLKKGSTRMLKMVGEITKKREEMAVAETPTSIAKTKDYINLLEARVVEIERYLGVKDGK